MTPTLRILSPDATPEEIAALITVFASIQTPATPKTAVVGRTSEWPVSIGLRGAAHLRPKSWLASRFSH